MQVEFKVEVIEINEQMPTKLEAMQAQGWGLVPGATPVAVYHLSRATAAPVAGTQAFGTLKIDESGVQILRDGKLVNGQAAKQE